MSFCLKKHFCLSPRHSVILSSKNICLPLSLCHYVFKKISVSLCHHVIMSSKKYMSPFVIMSLCLQKNICLPLSLCHYVFKKIYVSLCHYVIMSSKNICLPLRPSVILSKNAPVGDGSGPSCCCYCYVSFCLISAFHKLYYVLLHYFSLIYSF